MAPGCGCFKAGLAFVFVEELEGDVAAEATELNGEFGGVVETRS